MVDYSKWKNIEISDDEDDTHPNIDTPSLFRWRHQARVERMAEMERTRNELKLKKQSYQARLIDVNVRIKNKEGPEDALKSELADIESEGKKLDKEEAELNKKEKSTPWNVDTISKPGFEKTVINKKPTRKPDESLTDEEREKRMKTFVKENEKLCKQYGMLQKFEDSKRFLQKHPHLVCDDTANYLVIWSIDLELENKHELMSHVAHQCICMQYILELAKQLDLDPRSCISSFFTKIQHCLPEYKQQFDSEIEGFKKRIQKRTQEKIQEAMAEQEVVERKARLGPGGLDPIEVFDELPEELQNCFKTRDIGMLHKAIANMSVDDAKHYMNRCIESGLWIPNVNDEENGIKANENGEEKDNGDDDDSIQKQTGIITGKLTESLAFNEDNGETTGDKKAKKIDEPIYTGVSTDDLD